jgi:oxygen-independent coproporphyrinogen III oxidase
MEPDLPAHSLTGEGVSAGSDRAARAQARAGLYVHVPFCATRCTYCDFSSGDLSRESLDRYLAALEIEVGMRAPDARGTRFTSVFFGGGTPSALSARHFGRVAQLLREHFDIAPDAEITLEANPESVRPALLEAWARAGVNRLSMGAQSFDASEVAALGRIHAVDRPVEALALARAHGFRRLSLDLMFGFPGHTKATFASTLKRAIDAGTEHLSAYCFIPEPGTPLGNSALSGATPLPSPEAQAELYDTLVETLEGAGMSGYETSNFCRPGAEARHNLVYWLRRPYLGLGPSAHSLFDRERFGNHYSATKWARALEAGERPESERDRESEHSIAEEIVMLGLRLGDGIQPRDYTAADWRTVRDRFGAALEASVGCGRLERFAAGWRVPPALRFVADEAIAWVAARERRPDFVAPAFDMRGPHSIMMEPCPCPPYPAI